MKWRNKGNLRDSFAFNVLDVVFYSQLKGTIMAKVTAPQQHRPVTVDELPEEIRDLAEKYSTPERVKTYADKDTRFDRLKTKDGNSLTYERRLQALQVYDLPDNRDTPMTKRTKELLANPDAPQARDYTPSPDTFERIVANRFELHAIRTALFHAGKELGAARAPIQDDIAKAQRAEYKTMMEDTNAVLYALEAAMDRQNDFHIYWAQRGFPLWGRFPRVPLFGLTAAIEQWRRSAAADGLLKLSPQALETLCREREEKQNDADRLICFAPKEQDVSLPGTNEGVMPVSCRSVAGPAHNVFAS